MAHIAGGRSQKAPAQRMVDYVAKKMSNDLPSTSYIPGITNAPMHELLPSEINEPLRTAFGDFGKKMNGYYTEEAVILGVESRTSSPIRIPRDKVSMEHVQIANLYPCGEGAGYAGGILSAGIDGIKVAEALALDLLK